MAGLAVEDQHNLTSYATRGATSPASDKKQLSKLLFSYIELLTIDIITFQLNSMFLNEVSPVDIIKVVSKFKKKTSCVYDNINMSLVIDCIALPLALARKLSFAQDMII